MHAHVFIIARESMRCAWLYVCIYKYLYATQTHSFAFSLSLSLSLSLLTHTHTDRQNSYIGGECSTGTVIAHAICHSQSGCHVDANVKTQYDVIHALLMTKRCSDRLCYAFLVSDMEKNTHCVGKNTSRYTAIEALWSMHRRRWRLCG